MMRTVEIVEADVRYEEFVGRERAYFFALSTEEERAGCVARVVEYIDKHDVALKTLCKDIAGAEWNALESRVRRHRERSNPQVDEPEPVSLNTLDSGAIRQARSFVARAPDEVVASLSEEQLDALHGAVIERRGLKPRPARPEPENEEVAVEDEEDAKHQCEHCWFHCPSGRWSREG